MANKDLGIGVAGLGLGAVALRINEHAESRLKVRAVYEPDSDRRHQRYDVGASTRELVEKFDVDHVAPEYDDLLSRDDITCIAIFSPCPFHMEQVTAALRAGKHVLVTKPLAVSVEQARQITSLVESTGLKLLVAQSMRWNSMFLTLHDPFQQGAFGEIKMAEAYYVHDMRPVFDRSPWRYEMPQDLMYGGVCHPVDLLRWFVGDVEEVFAYGGRAGIETRYPSEKELNYVISLRHTNGTISRILGAYDIVHPPSFWSQKFHGVGLGLYGTKASLFNDRVVYDYYGKGAPREELITPKDEATGHTGEIIDCLLHFEDCVVNDADPLVDAWDGAQVVAVCSACWESIRTGQPVKVTREFDR